VSNVWLVIAIAHATIPALIEPIQRRHAPVTGGVCSGRFWFASARRSGQLRLPLAIRDSRGAVAPTFLSQNRSAEVNGATTPEPVVLPGQCNLNSNPGRSPVHKIAFAADPRRGGARFRPLGPNRRGNCSQVAQSGRRCRNRSVGGIRGVLSHRPIDALQPHLSHFPHSPQPAFRSGRSPALLPAGGGACH
jgi:hypothetical protein